MSEEFDMDTFMDELESRIGDLLQDNMEDIMLNQVEDVVYSALQDSLPEILSDCLANYDFVLKDGTIVKPKQRMRLLAPDKSKQLICYGGLRVDDTTKWSGSSFPKGWSLSVQTRVSSWECIYVYQEKEDAIAALEKVKKAMDDGMDSFEL